jgi:hypothetical protein
MLIELYLGTLTRYYSEQWQNGHTRNGHPSPFSGQPKPNRVNDPVELQGVIAGWLEDATNKLRPHLAEPLSWREGMNEECEVASLGFDGYGGAMLLAAYTVTGYQPRPKAFHREWGNDPAIELLSKDTRRNATWEMMNCNLWMPCRFQFGIGMKDPAGQPIRTGSIDMLWFALQNLNEANWKASHDQIMEWGNIDLGQATDFDTQARFGFSVFHRMCSRARERRLPLKLHF